MNENLPKKIFDVLVTADPYILFMRDTILKFNGCLYQRQFFCAANVLLATAGTGAWQRATDG
ncbi:hypothetical protein [Thermotalea metallivorans]|uniref:hypothetical protein n=1 Tax=Thermotalea metallivorans TaxID=520762 RepID=UPI0008398305|nr:hypothetical protein [Thermotalea metallivorans]